MKFLILYIVILIVILTLSVNKIIASGSQSKYIDTTTWTTSTFDKLSTIENLWVPRSYWITYINICKHLAEDPAKCIKFYTMVLWSESSFAKNCIEYNCSWLWDWSIRYSSYEDWIWDWVIRWNKYWFRQNSPSDFYRDDWIPPTTRYCMGELWDWVCVNGTNNAWDTWNKLNF